MRFPRSAWSVWDSPMLKDAAVMCSFYLGAQYPIVYIYIKFHINLLLMDIPSVSEFTKTWASVCVCVFVCVSISRDSPSGGTQDTGKCIFLFSGLAKLFSKPRYQCTLSSKHKGPCGDRGADS